MDRALGAPLRVHLAGTVCIEHGPLLVSESRMPGRQGRLAFVLLAAEHERAVSRDELAEELWAGEPPKAWETALRALVSKIRGVLDEAGLPGSTTVSNAFGHYQMRFPPGTWIDIEAAADAAHRAESALRAGRPEEANGWSLVAGSIARRLFLSGDDGLWVERKRAELKNVRVRALECRAAVCIHKGDFGLAVRDAEEVSVIEPFRESAVRLLMRAHAANGNRAQALRVYERCRSLISDELGTDPSSETEALYLEILRSV